MQTQTSSAFTINFLDMVSELMSGEINHVRIILLKRKLRQANKNVLSNN